jgi:hypothetical protein
LFTVSGRVIDSQDSLVDSLSEEPSIPRITDEERGEAPSLEEDSLAKWMAAPVDVEHGRVQGTIGVFVRKECLTNLLNGDPIHESIIDAVFRLYNELDAQRVLCMPYYFMEVLCAKSVNDYSSSHLMPSKNTFMFETIFISYFCKAHFMLIGTPPVQSKTLSFYDPMTCVDGFPILERIKDWLGYAASVSDCAVSFNADDWEVKFMLHVLVT